MQRIRELTYYKEKIKGEEIIRIVNLAVNDEKQTENLENRLKVLFGKKDSEEILENFKKEKTVNSYKINIF